MSETLADNSNISHYRIVSKIGAGGMGEFFLAEVTADAERTRCFFQEAKTAFARWILTPKGVTLNFFTKSKRSKKTLK